MRKCEQCGGVYREKQRDGMEYQHVCPPRPESETDNASDALESDTTPPASADKEG